MEFINNIFSVELINAIGWTILHSLWQSTLVAVFLGAALILLQKRSASVRYAISSIALALIFCFSIVTFNMEYQEPIKKNYVKVENQLKEVLPGFVIENNIKNPTSDEINKEPIINFQASMPLIVTLWMIGFVGLLIRYLGGIVYTQQLKNYRTYTCDAFWQRKVEELKIKLELDKKINLLESAIVKVPMMIGYLKPVILLPLGSLSSIPADQIESIILHELAHIKNRDYLINLIQKFIETLFFFNPAMWWISSIINKEREYCCDDRVLKITDNSISLAKALNNINTFNQPLATQAMMITGNKHKLLGRIKRMNAKKNIKSTLLDTFLIALVLVMGIVTTTAYSSNSASSTNIVKTENNDNGIRTYFFFKKVDGDKKEFEVKMKDGEIISVKIEGNKLSDSEIDKYREIIEEEIEDMNSGRKKNRKYRFNRHGKTFDFDFDFNFDHLFDKDFDFDFDLDGDRIKINLDDIEDIKELEELEELKELKGLSSLGALSALKSLESLKHLNVLGDFSELKVLNSSKFKKSMRKLDRKLKDLDIKLDGLDEKLEELGKRIEEAKKEMVRDGLIEDEDDDVSISFTNGYLYIDGEKQSTKISKKYKKIFGDIEFTTERDFDFDFDFDFD